MKAFLLGAAIGALLTAMPAVAQNTDHTPPGNPCGTGPGAGTGNPCNGNNGNSGGQGNVRISNPSPPIVIDMPSVAGRGAFIEQIGDANRARVEQTAPAAYGKIVQHGNRNVAAIDQRGSATSYARAIQQGDENGTVVQQDGTGQNVVFSSQAGNRNLASVSQTGVAGGHNGAILTQTGNNNIASLRQDGSDNLALMTQEGDNNVMAAEQVGSGNRLSWTQEGSGNSNLGITQTGAGSLMISQSRPTT